MLTKTIDSVELSPLSVDDYEALTRYLVSFPNETRDSDFWRDRFRLWWDDNPAFSEDMARGWVLKNKGDIVGFLGNLPSLFQWSGKSVVSYNMTTWRVLPDFRNDSLRLLYRQIHSSAKSVLFLTTPSDIVVEIIRFFNFRPILRGHQKMSLLFVNFRRILSALLGRNFAGWWAAFLLAPLLTFVQGLRLKRPEKKDEICARELFRADSSFDELWERTKHGYPATTVRKSELINWYCFGSDRFKKNLFGAYRGQTLLAYMIFTNPPARRLNVLECLDVWCDPEGEGAIKSLLGFIEAYAKKNSIDMIKFPGFSRNLAEQFKALGIFQKKWPEPLQYYKEGKELSESSGDPNAYFSHWVGDIGL